MAVKCPKDKVDYEDAKVYFEYHGVIVPNTPCLKCPKCGEVLFAPEQVKHIRERIAALGPEVKFTRKISKAGNRPAIYLPDVVVESMKLRTGDQVSIYMEGKRRLVIEPMEPVEA